MKGSRMWVLSILSFLFTMFIQLDEVFGAVNHPHLVVWACSVRSEGNWLIRRQRE